MNSIKIINFEEDLTSADIIIFNEKQEGYMARIHHIDVLLKQLENGKQINSSANYLYLPSSLVVDEINEENMFEMVNNLLDEGDFFNVFKRI
ncbi:hypothetical protein [Portibacter lacus]|uniref:hypothetical protein n=1 Tax=Portibacter lacus TaxID=1099794 RepID=UPI001F183F04|nr:hypothetical protein [Portibacter lacus]